LERLLKFLHHKRQSRLLEHGAHFLRVIAGNPVLVLNELLGDLWSVIKWQFLVIRVVLQVFHLSAAKLHRDINAISDTLSPISTAKYLPDLHKVVTLVLSKDHHESFLSQLQVNFSI